MAKAPQLNVRMDPTKILLLKEIAHLDRKSLNQLVDDELTGLISRRAEGVAASVRARADLVSVAAKSYGGPPAGEDADVFTPPPNGIDALAQPSPETGSFDPLELDAPWIAEAADRNDAAQLRAQQQREKQARVPSAPR